MQKFKNIFKGLTKFEKILWSVSAAVVLISYLFSPQKSIISILASLIGVTALIFVAKGYIIGQILTVAFAVLYGIISFKFKYYGEMITYLCMTAPIDILAVFSWLKNPYKNTKEVLVNKINKKQVIIMFSLAFAVTFVFYFILKALNTAQLLFSTISITTSFLPCYLTYLRSPYYALGYAANDIVLIILWSFAAAQNIAYLSMIFCFVMFLANDIYGFINWKRMFKKQAYNI